MPFVRIILDLPVANEADAAKIVASLEAQFPDRHRPSLYRDSPAAASADTEVVYTGPVDPPKTTFQKLTSWLVR